MLACVRKIVYASPHLLCKHSTLLDYLSLEGHGTELNGQQDSRESKKA